MCQKCPEIPQADAPGVVLDIKNYLKFLEGSINEYLSHHLHLEDQYRKAGMHYHRTQMSARRPDVFPEASLRLFDGLFLCSDAEWYEAIFYPLFRTMSDLTNLRDECVRYHGTVEELYHRVYIHLKPKYELLIVKRLVPWCEKLNESFEAARKLYDISRKSHETNYQGRRIAWYDGCRIDSTGKLEPRIMGEEWEDYLAWVGCLPETQRAVQNGRQVSEIAMELLFNDPEGLEEPETY